ncbi:MAG: hypothetical protein QXV83_03945 [Candidatus Anstonellaceae archaeon]
MFFDIYSAIIYGTLISTFILAIAFLFANFFSSSFLKVWVKKELADLFFFFGVCIVIIFIFNFFKVNESRFGDFSFYSYNFGSPPYPKIANKTILSYLLEQSSILIKNSFLFSKFSTFNYNFQAGLSTNKLIGLSFFAYSYTEGKSYSYGTNLILSQLMYAIDFCFSLILLIRGTFNIVLFLAFLSFNFLLPLGVLLRFIPFTKKIGGFILGYTLSFIFIFPLSVDLSSALFDYSIKLAEDKKFVDYSNKLDFPDIELPDYSSLEAWAYLLSPFYVMDTAIPAQDIAQLINLLFPAIPPGEAEPKTQDILSPIIRGKPIASFIQAVINLIRAIIPTIIGDGIRSYGVFPPQQIVEDFYVPLVKFVLPNLVLVALLSFSCIIMQFTFTIVLGKQFSAILGQEGNLFALQRLL